MHKFILAGLTMAITSNVLAETPQWSRTLDRVKSSVVSIRVDATRAFDGNWNNSTEATGFVVDAERGLILTNRHVVTPGPVVAEAVFVNGEEAELTAVYRDPVHDFGFFRYDTNAPQFIQPDALSLNPAGAQIGTEVRVIGNDAGEKLSILSGTLARLDRPAPTYSNRGYNDFNTFYLQSASGTSGGSSGSPVIDINGSVVALNAGAANQAASSFFLPLERVERALQLLREGQPVARGTLQTTFVHQPFDELRRLGLQMDDEREARKQTNATGMLVVERIIPESPAATQLQAGDVLLAIEGETITGFERLESHLDEAVDGMIDMQIQRGADRLHVTLNVQDLHQITPATYLGYSGGVLHNLSYQQARNLNLPINGVYIAAPGYALAGAGIKQGSIITEANGQSVSNIDEMAGVLSAIPDGENFPLRYVLAGDTRRTEVAIVRADRRWFPAEKCENRNGGDWQCQLLPSSERLASKPAPATIEFASHDDQRLGVLAPTLVSVRFDMPYRIGGAADVAYRGTGVVVDAQQGLVAIDRNTVPASLGDARITFGGQIELAATVEAIHPLRNLVLLRYQPAALGASEVRGMRIAKRAASPGDRVWLISRDGDNRMVAHSTEVTSLRGLNPPLSRSFGFRETNLDAYSVVNPAGVRSGVMVNESGELQAYWTAYPTRGQNNALRWRYYGIPAATFTTAIAQMSDGKAIHSLEVEFDQVPLFDARKQGLPQQWLNEFTNGRKGAGSVLAVKRLLADTPASDLLKGGDLLLAIDGEPINDLDELSTLSQKTDLALTIWRDDEEHRLRVPTVSLDGRGIDRVVAWAGAIFHQPHRAAREAGIEAEGAYISYYSFGSPASRFGLFALQNIVAINDRPIASLDTLLQEIERLAHRESARLRIKIWNGRESVKTLKADQRYWPASEFTRVDGNWTRRDLS